MAITPDVKDWTCVLERACAECGFDAKRFRRDEIGRAIRENAAAWPPLLARGDVRERAREDAWWCLEYACHVRDVYRIFDERLALMLDEDGPSFQNWDQDETALRDRHDLQGPASVATELVSAATRHAARYDAVADDQWTRPGARSNGSRFTVETLGVYGLHAPIHHLGDVTSTR